MVLRTPAVRLLPPIAAALAAGVAGIAIAQPGPEPESLRPTSELASDGGATAPVPAPQTGGASAPPAASAPAAPTETPATAAPPASEPPEPDPSPAPVREHEAASTPAAPGGTVETPAEADSDSPAEETDRPAVEPPPAEEALETGGDVLLPVEVLDPSFKRPAEAAPLIDTNPDPVEAPALTGTASLAAPAQVDEDDQDEGDGEVIIPVDPRDLPDDDPREDPDEREAAVPAPEAPAIRALARTGRDALPALTAGLLLLVGGTGLRLAVAPPATGASRARA